MGKQKLLESILATLLDTLESVLHSATEAIILLNFRWQYCVVLSESRNVEPPSDSSTVSCVTQELVFTVSSWRTCLMMLVHWTQPPPSTCPDVPLFPFLLIPTHHLYSLFLGEAPTLVYSNQRPPHDSWPELISKEHRIQGIYREQGPLSRSSNYFNNFIRRWKVCGLIRISTNL